jgi:hypothetical protein
LFLVVEKQSASLNCHSLNLCDTQPVPKDRR